MLQGSTARRRYTPFPTLRAITHADDISLACSVQGVKDPGASAGLHAGLLPCLEAPVPTRTLFHHSRTAWDHRGQSLSGRPVQRRVGTGNAADARSGSHARRSPAHADPRGWFLPFPECAPRHTTELQAVYRSRDPFFFTTPSDLEVDEDATVNFGIGYSLSGLTGHVLNDAGQGIGGVTVVIRSRGLKWSAVTDGDGSFFVASLVAGDYDVQVDEDSLPAGYSAEALVGAQRVTVGASSPGTGRLHGASVSQHLRTSAPLRFHGGPLCSREPAPR